jgi:hypothetical protein
MDEHNSGIWTSESYDIRVGFEVAAGREHTIVAVTCSRFLAS